MKGSSIGRVPASLSVSSPFVSGEPRQRLIGMAVPVKYCSAACNDYDEVSVLV
jgi:hypothetical protein